MNHNRKYPYIHELIPSYQNTCEKCKCGKVGKIKAMVQINAFRGEDVFLWVCEEHATACNIKKLYFSK